MMGRQSERLIRNDIFFENWEERWSKLGTFPDGIELRADCDITWEESQHILTAGDRVSIGTKPVTHEIYEVWQMRGHYGNARVLRIVPLKKK